MIPKDLHRLTEKDLTRYKIGNYLPIKLTRLTSWSTSWSTSYDSATIYSEYYYDTQKKHIMVLY